MQLMLPDHQATERRKLAGFEVIWEYRIPYATRETEYQTPMVLMVSLGTPANSAMRTVLCHQQTCRGPGSCRDLPGEKGTHTRSHKQGIAFLCIRVSRLPTLQLVKLLTADFARLNSRLAVGGQVLTGTDVIVNAETNLGATIAHEAESPDPVGDQETRGVIGGCLARGSAKTEGCEQGTVVVNVSTRTDQTGTS